ncbi:MAG TPA: DctP family TRAP transporter solute-binding subunit [Burkholderiales bacterium]|jgi:tripartite ATP-independent transporter DctP family solute receptor|nr:DctP family TRAP transporter solute-binding subunit [Burkholderiales bacterium]
MKRLLLFAVALLGTSLCLAVPAQAQKYRAQYRLSTVLPASYPWGRAGELWAKLVKEKTDGRINIKMYPGVSLVGGDQTREFTAIRQGVIDLAIGSTINWSPQIKQLNLFSMPFLMPDYKAIDALTHGKVGQDIFTVLEKHGVVPLAWGENGYRELSNSKHAIHTPADMKGMKFRVVGSPIFIDMFTALGANPTQMSFADAQPALSSGAVDGQENPLSVFVNAKMWTLNQHYLTLWHYTADPLIFVVNKRVWDSWTPQDQKAVREAAIAAGAANIKDARKGIQPPDDSVLKEIEAKGVTVTQLTDAQREQFKQATRKVYEKWTKVVGPALVKEAETAIANRNH